MANDEARNDDEVRITDCHPERSEAQSKDPAELLFGFATGFLDFARNDGQVIRHLSFGLPSSFEHRHFLCTCQSSTRLFGISCRKRDGRWNTSP
ncbi:MAG: hypothetical protein DME58_06420 [Verrucomicrobia bacterium]|nr:MAG: hypothetical protein DME58_06420 [Verrucomicrobiota bacterium]